MISRRTEMTLVLAGVLLLCIPPTAARAATDQDIEVIKRELESLKSGQDAIRKDIQEITKLLTARGRPPERVEDVNLVLDVSGDPYMGDRDARLTLLEFTDYQCPFCGRNTKSMLPSLEKDYIQTGKVKYVLQDFPLSFHKNAHTAAVAAHCAGEQGKYWEMHDQLFENQKAQEPTDLVKYGAAVGLDVSAFQACLESKRYDQKITDGLSNGKKAGVRGTPSFLLGYTEADGTRIKAVKIVRGAVAYPVFKQNIDALLAPKKEAGGKADTEEPSPPDSAPAAQ